MMMRSILSSALVLVFATGLVASNPISASAQALEAEGETPGTKVIVRDLKRDEGGTVTLRFQLLNDGEKPMKTYGVLGDLFTLDKVHLIDAKNKKKYLVVKDSAHKCLCSELKQDVVKGSKFNLWAKFPAPPADVQKISVIVPAFEPVESVPITDR
jgi:hypothetical protein